MRKRIGRVIHYYNRLGVAVLDLENTLKVGDLIHVSGKTTDFIQRVGSMEVDHRKVSALGPGSNGALQLVDRARRGDAVYLVSEDWADEHTPPAAGC